MKCDSLVAVARAFLLISVLLLATVGCSGNEPTSKTESKLAPETAGLPAQGPLSDSAQAQRYQFYADALDETIKGDEAARILKKFSVDYINEHLFPIDILRKQVTDAVLGKYSAAADAAKLVTAGVASVSYTQVTYLLGEAYAGITQGRSYDGRISDGLRTVPGLIREGKTGEAVSRINKLITDLQAVRRQLPNIKTLFDVEGPRATTTNMVNSAIAFLEGEAQRLSTPAIASPTRPVEKPTVSTQPQEMPRPTTTRISWSKQFGSPGDDAGSSLAVDPNGNVIVTGVTTGALSGQSKSGSSDFADGFVVKYDAKGKQLWTRQFGVGQGSVFPYSVAIDIEGNIIVAGMTTGVLPGQARGQWRDVEPLRGKPFVRKLDGTGKELWTRQFNEDTWEKSYWGTAAVGVATDSVGSVYVVGKASQTLDGQKSAGGPGFVRKYGAGGNSIWTRRFDGIPGGTTTSDIAFSFPKGPTVAVDQDGNIVVAASYEPRRDDDVLLAKFGASGEEVWTITYRGGAMDTKSMAVDRSGNIFVAGGQDGQLLRKYSPQGQELWTRQLELANVHVATDSEGSVYVVVHNAALLGENAYVRKYDSFGKEVWTFRFGVGDQSFITSVAAGKDGDIYIAGRTAKVLPGQKSAGGRDAFMMKIAQPVADK